MHRHVSRTLYLCFFLYSHTLTLTLPPKAFFMPGERRGSTGGSCGSSYNPSDPFCLQLVPTMEPLYLVPKVSDGCSPEKHTYPNLVVLCLILIIYLINWNTYVTFFRPINVNAVHRGLPWINKLQCLLEKGVNASLSFDLTGWPQSHLTSLMTLFSLEFCDCVNKERQNPLPCRSASMGLDGLYNLSWVKSTWIVWDYCILRFYRYLAERLGIVAAFFLKPAQIYCTYFNRVLLVAVVTYGIDKQGLVVLSDYARNGMCSNPRFAAVPAAASQFDLDYTQAHWRTPLSLTVLDFTVPESTINLYSSPLLALTHQKAS